LIKQFFWVGFGASLSLSPPQPFCLLSGKRKREKGLCIYFMCPFAEEAKEREKGEK
jgi:hypothetical protein